MSENSPATLKITFTPQESPAPTPEVVRDWVAREVATMSPIFIDHSTPERKRTSTLYDITAVDIAEQ
jgi:hypothetical protein